MSPVTVSSFSLIFGIRFLCPSPCITHLKMRSTYVILLPALSCAVQWLFCASFTCKCFFKTPSHGNQEADSWSNKTSSTCCTFLPTECLETCCSPWITEWFHLLATILPTLIMIYSVWWNLALDGVVRPHITPITAFLCTFSPRCFHAYQSRQILCYTLACSS